MTDTNPTLASSAPTDPPASGLDQRPGLAADPRRSSNGAVAGVLSELPSDQAGAATDPAAEGTVRLPREIAISPVEVPADQETPPNLDPPSAPDNTGAQPVEPAHPDRPGVTAGSGGGGAESGNDGGGEDGENGGGDGAGQGGAGDPPGARPKRDAIIYFPGLMRNVKEDTVDAVAHRIARALDHNHSNGKLTYTCSDARDVSYDGAFATRSATIVHPQAAPGQQELIDVYEYDYREALSGSFLASKPLVQAIQVCVVVVACIPGTLLGMLKRSQSPMQKLQVLYGAGVMLMMMLYVVMLGLTLAGTVAKGPTAADSVSRADSAATLATPSRPVVTPAVAASTRPGAVTEGKQQNRQPGATSRPTATRIVLGWFSGRPAAISSWISQLPERFFRFVLDLPSLPSRLWTWTQLHLPWLRTGVVSIAFLGLAFRFNLKELLARLSAEMTGAARYLATGERRDRITGQLTGLLNHLSEGDIEYENIHFVGYSFGSVIAMDSVFQQTEVCPRFDRVRTLVTIGCPFDFIRTYWRDYFTQRQAPHGAPTRWINVYAPADVLASTFQDGLPITGLGSALHPAHAPRYCKQRGIGMLSGPDLSPTHHIRFGPTPPAHLWEFVGWLLFIVTGQGFAAHQRYWDQGKGPETTAYQPVMAHIYPPTDRSPQVGPHPLAREPQSAPTPNREPQEAHQPGDAVGSAA